jgi:hypothetical protein
LLPAATEELLTKQSSPLTLEPLGTLLIGLAREQRLAPCVARLLPAARAACRRLDRCRRGMRGCLTRCYSSSELQSPEGHLHGGRGLESSAPAACVLGSHAPARVRLQHQSSMHFDPSTDHSPCAS